MIVNLLAVKGEASELLKFVNDARKSENVNSLQSLNELKEDFTWFIRFYLSSWYPIPSIFSSITDTPKLDFNDYCIKNCVYGSKSIICLDQLKEHYTKYCEKYDRDVAQQKEIYGYIGSDNWIIQNYGVIKDYNIDSIEYYDNLLWIGIITSQNAPMKWIDYLVNKYLNLTFYSLHDFGFQKELYRNGHGCSTFYVSDSFKNGNGNKVINWYTGLNAKQHNLSKKL